MKKLTTLAAVLALAAGSTLTFAQDEERPRERQRDGQRDGEREGRRGQRDGEGRPGFGGPPRFPNPVMSLFDTDEDGELSADEISKAADALRKLDRNEDGKVTAEELPRPQFGGGGRPGGPGGPGGPGAGFNPTAFLDRLMEERDTNKDGALSKEELEAADERQRGMLLRSDANEDGALDKSEIDQMRERFRSFGQGGRGFGRGRGPGGEGGDRPERPRRPERPERNDET